MGKKEWLEERDYLAYRVDDRQPHWIDNADSYICSVCGYEASYPMAICPTCKTDMTKGKKK